MVEYMEINRNTDPVFERQSTDNFRYSFSFLSISWALRCCGLMTHTAEHSPRDTHSRAQPLKHPIATLDPSAAAPGTPGPPTLLPLLLLLSRFSCVRLCVTPRWQPTRLPCPWDSPGKNTGVGCHCLLQCMKVKSLSRVWLFATPWTAAYQAPPPMEFSRQEYWSGVPLPSPMIQQRLAICCVCGLYDLYYRL